MNIILERYAYHPDCTLGRLYVGDECLYTIERPWIAHAEGDIGGESGKSCIPDGDYDLIPFTRPSGDKVYALMNPELGVFLLDEDRPLARGRYLILFHSGNWSKDVEGCIAPGTGSLIDKNVHMVTGSRNAMDIIRGELGEGPHSLTIRRVEGARDMVA